MEERELSEWLFRSETMPLWPRRLEAQLAAVSRDVVAMGTRTGYPLRDFLLFRDRGNTETNSAEENAMLMAGIAGGTAGVRKLGQGRKKKAVH